MNSRLTFFLVVVLFVGGITLVASPSSLVRAEDAASKEQVEQQRRQFREVGTAVSMSWTAGGRVRNDIRDFESMAKKLAKAKIDSPELAQARRKFFGVVTLYNMGSKRWARGVQLQDVEDVYRAFIAGLTDDQEELDESYLKILTKTAEIELRTRSGDAIVGAGVRTHAELWKNDILPVVRRVAGPLATFQPYGVGIIRFAPGGAGLCFKNVTGQCLTNVTLVVNSQIGSANEGSVTHSIFVPDCEPGSRPPLAIVRWRHRAGFKPRDGKQHHVFCLGR